MLGHSIISESRQPGEILKARLDSVVQKWCKGDFSYMVFSGGGSNISEANIMKDYFEKKCSMRKNCIGGIRVFLEERSTSTRTNAMETLQILKPLGWKVRRVLVVTSKYHASRSLATFSQMASEESIHLRKLLVLGADDDMLTQFEFFREVLATLYYFSRGWIEWRPYILA